MVFMKTVLPLLQLLGALPPDPQRELCLLHPSWGTAQSCYLYDQCLKPWRCRGCIALQQTYKQSRVDFNRKKTTRSDQDTILLQLHYSRSNIALIAADIAYWPANLFF